MVSWSQHLGKTWEDFREWLPPAVRDLPTWSWLTAGVVVLTSLWYLRRKRGRRLPPGPMGLPFIGAVQCFGPEIHMDLMRMRKTYGDIISFWLGGRLHVALSGYPLIKEALVNRGGDFADRPHIAVVTYAGFKDEIFAAPYNEQWKASRKFAAMAFKRFGVGGSGLMEDKILTEVEHVMEYLRDTIGSPIQLTRPIQNGLVRALTSILYSEEYSQDDPEVDRLRDMIHQWFVTVFSMELEATALYPGWLAKIVCKKPIEDAIAMNKKMLRYVQDRIERHRATLDTNNLRDVMDVYLAERENLDEERLAYTLLVFLPDGVHTLSIAVLWGFLYITYFSTVQDEIQKELDTVVGRSGRPTMAHRKDLLYLQATILEVFRITSMTPLTAPHKSVHDTTLAGYDVPSNAIILANIFSVHMDPQTFPDPQKFDPRHFLDHDGQLINADRCLPFSLGRRMCLGEQISKMEIFLYLANMLHQFRFSFPANQPKPPLTTRMIGSVLRSPEEYSVIATAR